RDYAAYITEERRKFVQAYIDTCSAAKASVDLTKEEQVYHYTLYYYDQADNLVRTIPPEGVAFLNDTETGEAGLARKADELLSKYDGPTANSNLSTALSGLKNVLQSPASRAIETWMYKTPNGERSLLAVTPDSSYIYQAVINSSQLNIDIYKTYTDTSGNDSLVLKNTFRGNTSGLPALTDWAHLVVQGGRLDTLALAVYLDGNAVPALSGGGALGWTADGSNTFPGNNLADIKHLRLYNRQLSSNEIRDNAENLAFMLGERYTSLKSAMLGWYRFNVPAPGTPTTISESSTLESKYPPVYPDHTLPTTYAYNSTNQVMMQHTPDGGTSRFWYDHLSRLTASQNAKQQAEEKYSYTRYDMLGRITEVGEKAFAASGLPEPAYLDSTAVNLFLAGGSNSQITQTLYDSIPVPGNGIQPVQQENLRKRVAASVYRETDSSSVKQASYYNYDMNGNVKTLYQSVYGLGIKTLDYEYDLVSGKVNFLRYQSGHPDQFYYQYKYDAENRLTEAWSGTKALVKPFGRSYLMDGKLDASYEYYLHGPLARIELGDQYGKVQGMDYAYTLQGWLKGVNGQKLDAATEIGADGEVVAKDVLA
ncbi:MAG TPA: hypothetical protein VGD31_17585, partial [Sphingobacteriaceae bacterium]